MTRPVIAILTDFGVRDHYVGAMKGVILGICPDATLVDLSHDIAPHDILGGALELAAAAPCFPQGTIFLVVVDPGVGSSRRAVAVESRGHHFVGPDNGVLSLAVDPGDVRVVELTAPRYARPHVSRTFEGRDRFAPAAAWLAKGIAISDFGDEAGPLAGLDLPAPVVDSAAVRGVVLRVDRFGNLITNIDRSTFDAFMASAHSVELRAGSHAVAGVVSTYADIASGQVAALFGSTDHLEIAAGGASAADRLALGRGAAVQVVRRA